MSCPVGVDDARPGCGFRPCGVNGSCSDSGLPWPVESLTSMFTHGSWAHLVGNMVFLAAFGVLVENLLGPVRFLGLYLVAALPQTRSRAG